MAVVLGIDAAWTERGSSGIALLVTIDDERGKIIASAPSYREFLNLTADRKTSWTRTLSRDIEPLHVAQVLEKACELAGAEVDLVAIDMPLWPTLIEKRRVTVDDAVSRAFGKYWAGVHSPTRGRPGEISVKMTNDFQDAGYTLATAAKPALGQRRIVEVFPLAALVELFQLEGDAKRPAYKVGKRYRSEATLDKPSPLERRKRALNVWETIISALRAELDDSSNFFEVPMNPESLAFAELKLREDVLDAIVCAWVGLCVFGGRAKAYGDEVNDEGSIWIPLRSKLRMLRHEQPASGQR
jgi:predicted RNase H-like nuclease